VDQDVRVGTDQEIRSAAVDVGSDVMKGKAGNLRDYKNMLRGNLFPGVWSLALDPQPVRDCPHVASLAQPAEHGVGRLF
jgi:hypothetical protein